ncbi:MAG: malectin domain-containing carbohydrate-binding protein, partial [Bacteroidota bacterium]
MFTVQNNVSGNGQTLSPVVTGALSFDPGTADFGFYNRWPFFQNRFLYSEDALNTFAGAIPHHVRVYALPGETDAYVIATEEHVSGFDYQDVVVIARNLRPAAEDPVVTDAIQVNFSDEDTPAPADYFRDFGEPFGNRGTYEYGWVTPGTNTPLSLVGNGRNRAPAQDVNTLTETLMHLQYDDVNGSNGVLAEGAWEIALPNGDYEVTVFVGDQSNESFGGTNHVINVEGVNVINEVATQGAANFFDATATVTLTDGLLTFDAIGGTNTKLLYLRIVPVNVQPPLAAIRINAGGTAAYVDAEGNTWELDEDFLTGTSEVGIKDFNVGGTTEDDLYLEYRFAGDNNDAPGDDWGYEVPITTTEPVTVKLHFIEPFFGVAGGSGADRGGAGQRQFDVAIEGQTVLENYDLNGQTPTPGTLIIETFENVVVTDGSLTIDFTSDINNAIISAVEIIGVDDDGDAPTAFFSNVSPADGATGIDPVNFQMNVVVSTSDGYELDKNSLASNVKLFEQTATGLLEIPANANDTGGGDAITLTPASQLKNLTTYVLQIDGVEANLIGDLTERIPFTFFTSSFTTTAEDDTNPPADLTGVSFTPVSGAELGEGVAERFSSLAVGPDGKLYASTTGEVIKRWDIAADGTLSNLEELTVELTGSDHPVTGVAAPNDRLIIGFTFAPEATSDNLVAYVTHSAAIFTNGPEWDGKLTKLSGPDLATVEDILIHLPRSTKDHLTNSVVFGPDGDIYIQQGSNSAGGEPDASWGFRPERLLAAAMLQLDLDKLPANLPLSVHTTADIAIINAAPTNSITMLDGTYNPYATNSPLTLYATGIRNAYDMVFHSNGWTYVPTNGTAGNNSTSPNTPGSAAYVNQDVSGAGVRRPNGTFFTDPTIPAVNGGETQKDWLFKSRGGSYHGHPNPYRGEFVLNHGGAPYGGLPGQGNGTDVDVAKYPDDLGPDANYLEPAFDFGFNKSPNGALEYKSNAFGGKMQGMLLVARFSGQDDIIVLQPGNNSGDIIQSFPDVPGLQGLDDPLEIVEDPTTGNLYAAQYDRGGNQNQQLILLRAADQATPEAVIAAAPEELLFETTVNNEGEQTDAQTVTISNEGTADLVITSVTLSGPFADQFNLGAAAGATLAPGETADYTVTYAPDLNQSAIGYQEASLVFANNSTEAPDFAVG